MFEPRQCLVSAIALSAASVLLVACTAKRNDEGNPAVAISSSIKMAIGGAGSTFINPIMTRWIEDYRQKEPGIQVTYRSIGSGAGIEEYKKQFLGFAASDAPLSDDQVNEIFPTIQVPVAGGPVCIIYNLPDLKGSVRLSPQTLAGIYLGKIISWQDAQIAGDNPGVALPKAPVIVVHRSDGSGTTNIFTSYLNKVSVDWSRRAGQGLTVTWPVGLSAEGSKRVTELVKETVGTIGYAELSYAKQNGLPVASIQNRAGTFVTPSPESASAAIEAFSAALAQDARSPIVDPPASAKEAYPISGLTFVLIPRDGTATEERQAIKDFIQYTATTGQSVAEELSYAKLPASLQQLDQKLLGGMRADGQPLK
jgi:phosphate transport system substrate-binding protein